MSLKIEYLEISELVPYANNARVHGGQQLEEIVASIKEFGFTNPILIDEGNVLIAGHGRIKAAKLAGLEKLPCIRLAGLSESQKKALRIADNQIPLNASWDMDLLMQEVQELDLAEFDLSILAFDEKFLDSLLDDNELADLDGGTEESKKDDDRKYLRIDKEKVPITEEEASKLIKVLNDYIDKYGTTVGFAKKLLSNGINLVGDKK